MQLISCNKCAKTQIKDNNIDYQRVDNPSQNICFVLQKLKKIDIL